MSEYYYKGEFMSYRLNLELIVTTPVLQALKEYDINIPEVCITSIMSEIERRNSISNAITITTASKDNEIRHLKEALRIMQENLEKAEARAAEPMFKLWHRK
jgi:flagellar assembly factor FliW